MKRSRRSASPIVAVGDLHAFVAAIFERAGCDRAEAKGIAGHLVGSNLAGHDSHGVGLTPKYIDDQRKGIVSPGRSARLLQDAGAILQFDGQEGFGWTVASQALAVALRRTMDTGLVLLTLGNSHHLGRIGGFGELAAESGLVSLHFVNVTDHPGFVAPHGGRDARLGTNPVCIGFPSARETPAFVLDFATSKIALNKVRVALDGRKFVPKGSLLDARGKPSRDPSVMFAERQGALLPFAAHKGYALAYACELLAGVLSRHGTVQPGNLRRGGFKNCLTTVLIDPKKLGDWDWMQREVDATARHFLASPPSDPKAPVMMPGDPERRARAQRTKEGIPVAARTLAALLETARSVGVPERDLLRP